MSKKPVLDKFDKLPPEAKKEASDFVQFLYDRHVKSTPKKPKSLSQKVLLLECGKIVLI